MYHWFGLVDEGYGWVTNGRIHVHFCWNFTFVMFKFGFILWHCCADGPVRFRHNTSGSVVQNAVANCPNFSSKKTQFRADKCSNTSGFVAIKTSRKYLNIMPKGFGFAAANTSGKCLDILQKNVKRFHSDRYRNAVTPIAPTSPIWQSAHINVIWIISQKCWYDT